VWSVDRTIPANGNQGSRASSQNSSGFPTERLLSKRLAERDRPFDFGSVHK
jgi:hypothetical protein